MLEWAGKSAARNAAKKTAVGVGKTFGGNSIILAERIGTKNSPGWAAHHIIPVELSGHKALKKIGMDMDEVSNGIALPMQPGLHPTLPLHRGSHPEFSKAVKDALDAIPEDASMAKTKRMVNQVKTHFREQIESGQPLHNKYGGQW